MKRFSRFFAAAILTMAMLLVWSAGYAQSQNTGQGSRGQHGNQFIDANGDGYNDNAADHDGDGIPNGQDPDYVRSGFGRGHGFVDADGDGINDWAQDADGDGIPNGQDTDYIRPRDGSGRRIGMGRQQNGTGLVGRAIRGFRGGSGMGTGICNGTGPMGLGKGRSK
jgi:hypothetical protein